MASALPLMAALILQQQGFYNQVIPKTTGENGYEEYVLAAELAGRPGVKAYIAWQPRQDASQIVPGTAPAEAAVLRGLIGKTPLQAKRQLMRENSRILDLIRQGNTKPVLDPRLMLDANTLFPELAGMRAAARVCVASSEALLADGRSAEAARVMGDALKMGANIQQSTLISFLVGIACQAIVLGGMNDQLDRYSEIDWKSFVGLTTELLQRPSPMPSVMRGEARLILKTLADVTRDRKLADAITTRENSDFAQRLKAMSDNEITNLLSEVEKSLRVWISETEEMLRQPESKWRGSSRGHPTNDSERLLEFVLPSVDQTFIAHARLRTQLRLLRLHALVQIYRWNWNELPTSLDQATGRAELSDPLTEGDFNYERTSTGYRLYSKGSEATGEIELRYRRPQGGTSGAEAPPK